MINDLLRFCYEKGWSDDIYSGVVIFAFVAQLIFLIFYRKKYVITLMQSILTVLLVYPAAYFWMLVLTWIENGFQNWGENNIIRMYVYAPLICVAVAKLLAIPARKMIDYLAPSMALQQVIGHSICPFAGCCQGYACSWGIWNPVTDTYLFPNQWLECLVALTIVIYLLRLAKREKYVGTGRVYAMFLVIFGGTRFLLEFLRDNDKLIFGISNLAFHALFMVIVGSIWLRKLNQKQRQEEKKPVKAQKKRRK